MIVQTVSRGFHKLNESTEELCCECTIEKTSNIQNMLDQRAQRQFCLTDLRCTNEEMVKLCKCMQKQTEDVS